MTATSALAILPDPQLLAMVDAFETASMETSVSPDGLLLWYLAVEEIARRDLMTPEARAGEADWIVGLLCPEPGGRIFIDHPPLPPGTPRVSVNFVGRAAGRPPRTGLPAQPDDTPSRQAGSGAAGAGPAAGYLTKRK